MRSRPFICVTLPVALSVSVLSAAARPTLAQEHVPGQLLVRFANGTSALGKLLTHTRCGGTAVDLLDLIGVEVVQVVPLLEETAASCYGGDPSVDYAELDYLASGDATPNDPYYASQQYGPQKVQAPAAWDITTGDTNVLAAVLDSGADFAHPDLAGKLVLGWDYVNNDSDPSDDHGHGTHVAGILGAATNNQQGVAGIAWQVRVLAVKVLDKNNKGSYSNIAKGILYAADQGARVINLSLGGTSASSTLLDAVEYGWGKGALLVAAAGNGATSAPYYPAAYAHVVAVAATDAADGRWSLSNYGDWVALAAPGDTVYSTNWKSGVSGYLARSGTSQAAPHVSGVAALLLAQNGGRTNAELRTLLESTADDLGAAGRDVYFGYGRVNAARALGGSLPPPGQSPAHIGDLDGSGAAGAKNWKATVTVGGHDGGHGALAGATVSGAWGGGTSGTASCTTDAAGSCSVTSRTIQNSKSSATFTVTNVSHPTKTYQPAGNHDADGDSNGTQITVVRP